MATMAPAGPEVPAAISMPRQIITSWGMPTGRAKASDSNRQLPRQKAMARLILRSGRLRHMRSLSMPQRIMPAPLHSTMIAATAPALSVPIA
ncbi:hypothetical protein D3C71_2025300 [compost metagenome]